MVGADLDRVVPVGADDRQGEPAALVAPAVDGRGDGFHAASSRLRSVQVEVSGSVSSPVPR